MQKNINLKNLTADQITELIPADLALLCYRGSVAHGLYAPSADSTDDKDLLGVYIAPKEHYLGFGRKDVYEKWIMEYDAVYYELRKFLSLLLKCNPNVLSVLWTEPKHVLVESHCSRTLREHRNLFVSKKAYHSFTGYAYSQLKRMEQFQKQGYMGEKRKQLVSRFGYDPKNAAHLIRLLNMGVEFLNEGRLYVERTSDAGYLLSIKRGEHSLDSIKKEAEHLFRLAKEAYVRSSLPAEPDRDKVEKLLIELLESEFMYGV